MKIGAYGLILFNLVTFLCCKKMCIFFSLLLLLVCVFIHLSFSVHVHMIAEMSMSFFIVTLEFLVMFFSGNMFSLL